MMCIHIYIYVYIYTYIYVYFSSQCGEVISKCNIKPYIEKINKSEQCKNRNFSMTKTIGKDKKIQ